MKLQICILLIMLSTVFTSSYYSSGIFWFLGNTKRKSNLEAEKIPVIGELAYFSHELAYEKQSEIVEWKNEDNLYDYMSSAAHVEIGAFKAIYGRLTRDPEYVIIVFRGTNSIANLKTDVNQSLADLTANANKIGYGCKVHEGFLEGYKGSLRAELRSKFSTFLKERVNDDGVKKIVISGHSLGGALATLYAYDFGVYLKSENHGFNSIPKLYLVTFGSPRVGDECFRKVINEKLDLTANARFVYKEDSITSLPYKQPYVHVGTEYNFVNYEKFVVKKFNADESARVTTFTGAIYTLAKKIKDHLKYKNINKSKLVHAIENNVDSLQKKKTRLRKS